LNVVSREAIDRHSFAAIGDPTHDPHRAPWHVQPFRQKPNQLVVRGASDRWFRKPDANRVTVTTRYPGHL
jgi:hypothetical protein